MNDLQTITLFTLIGLVAGLIALWTVWVSVSRRQDPVLAALLGAFAGKAGIEACQFWALLLGREQGPADVLSHVEFAFGGITALFLFRAARKLQGRDEPTFGLIFLAAGAAGASGAWLFNEVPFLVSLLPVLVIYLAAHAWAGGLLLVRARKVGRRSLAVWSWSLLAYVAWMTAVMPTLLKTRLDWVAYLGEGGLSLLACWWLAPALVHDALRQAQASPSPTGAPSARRRDLLALLLEALRSPLAAIKTSTYVLSTTARSRLTSEEADMLGSVVARAEHLVRLVSDVTDYSRILDGSLVYDRQPENLVTLVRQACGHEQPALARRQLTLDVSLPVTPLRVMADRLRVLQLLETLLTHARRETPPGGAIHVRLSSVGEFCVLEVADSGEALTTEHLAALFAGPGPQDGPAPPPADTLAFAIARDIVERGHGGLLSVTSEDEVGTTFTVTLPLSEPAPVPADPEEDGDPLGAQPDPWQGVLGG